jgi:hypothetical protein
MIKNKKITALLPILILVFIISSFQINFPNYAIAATTSYTLDSNFQDSQGLIYTLDNTTKTASVAQSEVKGKIIIPETVIQNNITYTVTEVGEKAFQMTDITDVTIPDTIKTLGDLAFYHCDNLKSIKLPSSLEKIGDYAFSVCPFTEITISENVSTIGSYVFSADKSLKNINVSDKNKYFSSVDGVLYNKDKTVIEIYPLGKTADSYKILSTVKEIGSFCFHQSGLKSVTIPESVTEIGSSAFSKMENLESISIPDSVTKIYSYAFYGCTNLKNVRISRNLEKIEDSVFMRCKAIEDIVIPKSVDYISTNSFSECTNLKRIAFLNKNIDFADTIELKNINDAKSIVNNSVDKANNYSYTGVVSGFGNSTTKEYAEVTGYEFKNLMLGDVNDDGYVNSADAVIVLRYYANSIINKTYDGFIDEDMADVNFDGKIDSVDAVRILVYYANSILDKNIVPMDEFFDD